MRVLLGSASPAPGALIVDNASEWPFRRHVTPPPSNATAIHIRSLHLAFPAGQVAGTRLVLTQSTYQLQRWLDWASATPGVTLTADANAAALRQGAAEAFVRRGPWSRIEIVDNGGDGRADGETAASVLHDAFVQPDPAHRLEACADALRAGPANTALLLALGSTHMELQDVGSALDILQQATAIAPDWEATHFELGKAWLRADDTPRAAEAFSRATHLMPAFATAWSNLGAALGEMERRDEAIVALRRALEHDPYGHPVLNNLGVALRDLGRYAEAEALFRQVVAIAPSFVFGRYNLAQTLLLAESFDRARQEYEEAFARDSQKSARQAMRLGVARAAAGDVDGATRAITDALDRLAGEPLAQAVGEARQALSRMSGAVSGNEKAVASALRLLAATRRR